MRLVDRVALVTGASRGIGHEIALRLASEGCHVAVTARAVERLEGVVQQIENAGCKSLALKLDVTKSQQVMRAFQRVKRRFGRLDILVNNVGLGFKGPFEEMRTQEIRQQINVNLLGIIECCRRAIPIMKEQGEGCIINIASMTGVVGAADMAVYAATKWAVRGLGLSLSQELRQANIRVHNVCPGGVDTDFFENLPEDDPMRREDPELRLKPDDVAQAVVYLATLSERARVDELFIGARKLWMNR